MRCKLAVAGLLNSLTAQAELGIQIFSCKWLGCFTYLLECESSRPFEIVRWTWVISGHNSRPSS